MSVQQEESSAGTRTPRAIARHRQKITGDAVDPRMRCGFYLRQCLAEAGSIWDASVNAVGTSVAEAGSDVECLDEGLPCR